MDDSSHVFLIKDKIRCIQKKIMDQLAADLNSALNDADILTSSMSHVPMTSSSSFNTIMKTKRRRKRPLNNDVQQQKTEASDSTTPENPRNRTGNKPLAMSDGDDLMMTSKTQSSSLLVVSESDSASQTDEIRRRRRPFKKPIVPSMPTSISKVEQPIKLIRCSSMKVPNTTTIVNTTLFNRRHHTRQQGNNRSTNIEDDALTPPTTSSLSLAASNINYIGKRKRSRAIVHDDFRMRNNCMQDYDMTGVDDSTLTNVSSSSSLNLSDSDQDPCLTSNEADDEQSDWPREESSVPRMVPWNEDNEDDDDDDDDNKMLTTTDGALRKIVSGAFNMIATTSKTTMQNRMNTFANRAMLTGNRRSVDSRNAYAHPHVKRHVRMLKEARRSHHNSYNHKRVKSDHFPHRHHDVIEPIDSTNIGHQLLEKIGWTPGNGLGLNQDGITAVPVNISYRSSRQGLGYENAPMDTSERMESEQSSSFQSSQPSHV